MAPLPAGFAAETQCIECNGTDTLPEERAKALIKKSAKHVFRAKKGIHTSKVADFKRKIDAIVAAPSSPVSIMIDGEESTVADSVVSDNRITKL